MTYNVFGGTLNLTQLVLGFHFLYHVFMKLEVFPQITLVQSVVWEDVSPKWPAVFWVGC